MWSIRYARSRQGWPTTAAARVVTESLVHLHVHMYIGVGLGTRPAYIVTQTTREIASVASVLRYTLSVAYGLYSA